MPYATLFLMNVIKFSSAMHGKHLCGCNTTATTYAKVKSTPTTESGDRQLVTNGDYSQVVMAVPRGKKRSAATGESTILLWPDKRNEK